MSRLVAITLALLALGATTATVRAETPPCITWRSEVVLALVGHNHVVVIENGCNRPATCIVSTDVAPDPIQATVPAKQKVELVTFRGSPSATFKAKVDCTLR